MSQSGYGWCDYQVGPAAYIVINLGPQREHGHLAASLFIHTPEGPLDCAQLRRDAAHPDGGSPPDHVLFCTDRTASTPLMYAMTTDTSTVEAGASYADGKAVVLQSISEDAGPPAFTSAQLSAAASDPRLHAAIPDAGGVPPQGGAPTPVGTR